MKNVLAVVSILSAVAACGSDESTSESTTSQAIIKDGNNSGGTAGFYFLGAFGNPPASFPGTFDGGFKSQLSMEFLHLTSCSNGNTTDAVTASFPTGILVYPASSYYYFSKNAALVPLAVNNCYRMQIKLAGFTLGFRDIQVTTGVVATGYVKVTPTSNIQVSFRLETSLRTDTDTDTVPDWRDNCPTVANTNQTDAPCVDTVTKLLTPTVLVTRVKSLTPTATALPTRQTTAQRWPTLVKKMPTATLQAQLAKPATMTPISWHRANAVAAFPTQTPTVMAPLTATTVAQLIRPKLRRANAVVALLTPIRISMAAQTATKPARRKPTH